MYFDYKHSESSESVPNEAAEIAKDITVRILELKEELSSKNDEIEVIFYHK